MKKNEVAVTVHILDAEKPLCGFSANAPREWPAGHYWVSTADAKRHADCAACITALGTMQSSQQ